MEAMDEASGTKVTRAPPGLLEARPLPIEERAYTDPLPHFTHPPRRV